MDPDPDKYPAKARMAKKLASEEGRRRYARRKWMAEAPVGWIKEVMGFRRFSFRGLEKVQVMGFRRFSFRGLEKVRRMGPRVPSPQRQAAAHPPGRLSAPWPTPSRR